MRKDFPRSGEDVTAGDKGESVTVGDGEGEEADREQRKNKKIPEAEASGNLLEVTTRFELVDEGFADPCLTTWPRHHI